MDPDPPDDDPAFGAVSEVVSPPEEHAAANDKSAKIDQRGLLMAPG
jgi:hypothetical protein